MRAAPILVYVKPASVREGHIIYPEGRSKRRVPVRGDCVDARTKSVCAIMVIWVPRFVSSKEDIAWIGWSILEYIQISHENLCVIGRQQDLLLSYIACSISD